MSAPVLIRIVDFEATGIPTPDDKHAIVEAGWCDLMVHDDGDVSVGEPVSMLVNPGRPIPPEAMATHHIRDIDVAGCPSPSVACQRIGEGRHTIYAAHNAEFDRQFIGSGDRRWICTYKVALRIWPDAPSHKNQVLRYMLALDHLMDRELTLPSHRAGPDAYVTAWLLREAILTGKATVEEMVRWSSGPALLPRITFGKHKGKSWDEAPTDYLTWLRDKSDMDSDVKANARHHLKQRAAKEEEARMLA